MYCFSHLLGHFLWYFFSLSVSFVHGTTPSAVTTATTTLLQRMEDPRLPAVPPELIPAVPCHCSGHGACNVGSCVGVPRWLGTDCAVPVCASCGQGVCMLLGACKCRKGWQGLGCAKPTPHAAAAAAVAVRAVAVVLGGLVAVAADPNPISRLNIGTELVGEGTLDMNGEGHQ